MTVSDRACLAPQEARITVTLRARCKAPGGPLMMPTWREVAEVGPEQVRVHPTQDSQLRENGVVCNDSVVSAGVTRLRPRRWRSPLSPPAGPRSVRASGELMGDGTLTSTEAGGPPAPRPCGRAPGLACVRRVPSPPGSVSVVPADVFKMMRAYF
ncbi:unnamed protein product [Rangifer tarandus platyrhynchus]|uniref:Uncharacterized protein n=1 Tax=Rangifer tarandus platyrhynchus TaxID=3082113 RepID=A0AC59YAL1_RANTA